MLERFTGREKLGAAPLIVFNSRQLIDKAYSYQDVELQRHGNCPVPSGVLTPPQSSEKTEELVPVDAAVLKIKPGFKLHPHNDAVQSSDAITETDQTTANPK
ncbi:hypothetical protein F7725_026868 [Dissostichus mawsoni]|uniref:Uncharacterized protein n=1 Tax=Dissostichus mawsoni TaxID=36200 RepID=A0A7J5X8P2_DISMA|nr:hypothetical protein F7725_026868 [Dissostichus mawsoni]